MVASRILFGSRLIAISAAVGSLAACSTTGQSSKHSKEYFSESEYGVSASQRVVQNGPVPKGGGREMVGAPYVVKGKRYVPHMDPHYNKVGYASWYGSAFHGRYTANGEIYDKNSLSAASPTMPLPSYARVTNLENGSSVIVRVNDRGPFERGRIIDLSSKTADLLDMKRHGTAKVRVQYVGRARMDGLDQAFLMASYVPKGGRIPGGQIATGVMVASAGDSLPSSALADVPIPSAPPALALASPTPEPVQFEQLNTAFTALPDIGPIPADRPTLVDFVQRPGSMLIAGYAETANQGGMAPFRAVMTGSYRLTAEQIRRSYLRQHRD